MDLATAILSRIFLKVASDGKPLIATKISENDFARMCRSMDIIDNTEKSGISQGKISILFSTMLRNLAERRLEREQRRYKDRGGPKKKMRARKHLCIKGLSQLGILFEELYKALPGSRATYGSPMNLVLICLEKADQHNMQSSSSHLAFSAARSTKSSSGKAEKKDDDAKKESGADAEKPGRQISTSSSRPGSRSAPRGDKSTRRSNGEEASSPLPQSSDSQKKTDKPDKPNRDGKKKNTLTMKAAATATRVTFDIGKDATDDKQDSEKNASDDKQESQKDTPDDKLESQKEPEEESAS